MFLQIASSCGVIFLREEARGYFVFYFYFNLKNSHPLYTAAGYRQRTLFSTKLYLTTLYCIRLQYNIKRLRLQLFRGRKDTPQICKWYLFEKLILSYDLVVTDAFNITTWQYLHHILPSCSQRDNYCSLIISVFYYY